MVPPKPGRPAQAELEPWAILGMMKFAAAREAVVVAGGPELFACPVAASLAAAILSGEPWRPERTDANLERARSLVAVILRDFEMPYPEKSALYIVGCLAHDRHGETTAAVLRWGARQLEAGEPIEFVAKVLAEAVGLATGRRDLAEMVYGRCA